jgi:hypothetical protein
MTVHELGYSATSSGWRKKVADALAPRLPVADRHVRTALGLLFLASSIRYVVRTVRGAAG